MERRVGNRDRRMRRLASLLSVIVGIYLVTDFLYGVIDTRAADWLLLSKGAGFLFLGWYLRAVR